MEITDHPRKRMNFREKCLLSPEYRIVDYPVKAISETECMRERNFSTLF
ncbi:MAG: hypothetical protein PHG80_10610 [Methanoregulaceae archaeon]|jgi:hypothetical protein|nr:hypothetical protein [Methanoregulaceae archaeon]